MKKKKGRPKKEPTTVISFRVQTEIAEQIKEKIKKIINDDNKLNTDV